MPAAYPQALSQAQCRDRVNCRASSPWGAGGEACISMQSLWSRQANTVCISLMHVARVPLPNAHAPAADHLLHMKTVESRIQWQRDRTIATFLPG